MSRKILAIAIAAILIAALSVPAMAAPFNGGTTISGEKTLVHGVNFDTDDFYEFTLARAEAGGWNWYFDARTNGTNYAHRSEYSENQDGPQTEEAEVGDFGEIGAICYTSGPWEDHEGEWVQYTLNVETGGKYDIKMWASSGASGKSVNVEWNGAAVGLVDVGNTDWSNYAVYDVGEVQLAKGSGVLKIDWPEGDVNVAGFEFILLEADAEPEPEPDGGESGDAAPADGGAAAPGGSSSSSSDDDGGGMMIWIIIGAVVVIGVIVVIVLVTKKKS